MADAFPISGSIDAKAFPFLLMQLHKQGATGSLKVEGPSYQKALYFRGGRILFGSSNDPRDQLGSILIESGKITPEQLEDVNAKVGPGNPLAKVLSDTGFVNQRELSDAARAKVERILSDVIGYTSGSFEFEDGVLPKGAVDLKLSTDRLVMAAVRRISDRNFVLRYIEGLEVVLAPTPELPGRLSEIQADGGGLPEQLDGHRTLKQAAALTRLDDFEAAKIACALLFMGLARRGEAAAEAAPVIIEPDVEPELDLGATAAIAFTAAPAATAEPEVPAFSFGAEAEAEPAPFVLGDEGADAAIPLGAERTLVDEPPVRFDEPPVKPTAFVMPEAEPVAKPEPIPAPAPEPPPAMIPPPSPPMDRRPPAREWVPPSASRVSDDVPTMNVSAPPRPSAPPSKEDLAALDALLNTKGLEGPLTPLEKEPDRSERWTPQFGHKATGRGGRRRGGDMRRNLIFGGVAVVVLAAAAAAWLYLKKPSAPASAATPPPTRPAALPVATTPPAPAAASTPATTRPVPAATTPVRAVTTPLPTPPGAATSQAGGGVNQARALLRGRSYPEAAQGFLANVRAAAPATATVQLLVACSTDTIQKAADSVDAPELFIVPVNYKGRDCYRLCWGLYPDSDRAASAAKALPEYFRKGGASPRVISAAEIAR